MQVCPLIRITRWLVFGRRIAGAETAMIGEARQVSAPASPHAAVGPDSLDAFYDACAARAYGLALRVLNGDRGTAEDIVAETFVAVRQSRPVGQEGEMADLEHALLRHVRKRCLDVLRGRQDAGGSEAVTCLSPGSHVRPTRGGAAPTSAAIREQVTALSLDQRQTIERAFYQGQTSAQIAKEMGISKGAVQRAMRSGLRTLADRLSDVASLAG